ncbi:MAG: glycosyltransferase family 2 protein [Armatimonadota bacterium]|nr:glycosyltransferase family 2 protein [Armatimonadota bacterium]
MRAESLQRGDDALVWRGGTWVILPAYNEAKALPSLLDGLARLAGAWHDHASHPLRLQVIVVDDGSVDGTAEAAEGFADRVPVTVLRHSRNEGLTAAIRTGMAYACRAAAPDDVIITMDADNTHRPEQIPDLVRTVASGADIVIASRYHRGARQAGVPRHRELLSAGVCRLLGWRYGLPDIRDYSCGYRAYRAGLLHRALHAHGDRLITAGGFAAPAELLTKLAEFTPRVVEIPLDLRYDLKVGSSKMPTMRTIVAYLRLLSAPRPRLRV